MSSTLDHRALTANQNIAARDYWKKRLSGFEPCEYFSGGCFAGGSSPAYARWVSDGGSPAWESLRRVAKTDAARHIILLSALGILLHKIASVADVCVFTPVLTSNSTENGAVPVIPVRMNSFGEMTFPEFVTAIKGAFVRDCGHADYPIGRILKESGMGYAGLPVTGMSMDQLPDISAFGNIGHDVLFHFAQAEAGDHSLLIEYRADKFTPEYIAGTASAFYRLLLCLLDNKEKKIGDIELISEAEKRRYLYEFNNTNVASPAGETVLSLFETQTERAPGEVALEYGELRVSYAQLREQAMGIGAWLGREKAIRPGELVGILRERDERLLPCMLGIWMAGAAYIPIDAGYPPERIAAVVAGSGMRLLLTSSRHCDIPVTGELECVDLDRHWDEMIQSSGELPAAAPDRQMLAYVLFTSGSTGVPKGVGIEHGSLVNYLRWAAGLYVGSQRACFPLFTSVSFDLTVTSLFVPLITGNTLVIFGEGENSMILQEVIAHDGLDVIKLTPSHLKMVRDCERISLPAGNKVKTFIVGGEDLPASLAAAIHDRYDGRAVIYNEYGPTEATVGCMICRFDPKDRQASVPLGHPIDNSRIYILGEQLRPTPTGGTGEIYIGGQGLARGYIHNAELTAQRFIPDPFVEGGRMYRTGDLAVREWDGKIFYKGRIDHQVKIRGFRIETGDIEAQLLRHSRIKEAVVLASGQDGDKILVAYYVSTDGRETKDLGGWLAQQLPLFMIPTHFVHLPEMPLNINGKLDRKILAAIRPQSGTRGQDATPSGETESRLAEIWSAILRIDGEKISSTRSFFSLGGHSLLLIKLKNEIQKYFGVGLELSEIFPDASIRGLAARIEQKAGRRSSEPIPQAEEREYYPVSYAQRRMIYSQQMLKAGASYNSITAFHLSGDWNIPELEDAFCRLIARHDVFRTSFHFINGAPVAKIARDAAFSIHFRDIRAMAGEEEAMAALVRREIKEFVQPFDLSKAPLFRVGILQTGEQEAILLFDIDHSITDGLSHQIVARDFLDLFDHRALASNGIQYKDYVIWQHRYFRSRQFLSKRDYWLRVFERPVSPLELPTDHPRTAGIDYTGSEYAFSVDAERTGRLNRLARSTDVTLPMLMLAVLNVLLYRLTKQKDICIGLPFVQRNRPELSGMVGILLNTIVLRSYPEGTKKFSAYLQEVREASIGAYANGEYPFEMLLEDTGCRRMAGRNPLFDILFNPQPEQDPALSVDEAPDRRSHRLRFTPLPTGGTDLAFDIALFLNTNTEAAGIQLKVLYKTALFEDGTIRHLMNEYCSLLDQVGNDAALPLDAFSLFKPAPLNKNKIRIVNNNL